MKKLLLILLLLIIPVIGISQETNLVTKEDTSYVNYLPLEQLRVPYGVPTQKWFICFVDPRKADNSGDGFSWTNAKKNLQGVFNIFNGSFLRGHRVQIYVRGNGSDTNLVVPFYGGGVEINFARPADSTNLLINNNNELKNFTDSAYTFYINGRSKILETISFSRSDFGLILFDGRPININGDVFNETQKHFVFKRIDNSSGDVFSLENTSSFDYVFSNCVFDISNQTSSPRGISISYLSQVDFIQFGGCKFIGGNNLASTDASTTYNRGFVYVEYTSQMSSVFLTFSNNHLYGIKKLIAINYPSNVDITATTATWLQGTLGDSAKPIIQYGYQQGTSYNTLRIDTAKWQVSYRTVADKDYVFTNYGSGKTSTLSEMNLQTAITTKKFNLSLTDSTRTFGAVSDSVLVKVTLNGQDYWLKLIK